MRLDEELERSIRRRLEEACPYMILDARYERIRLEGVIRSRAVLVGIEVDGEGRRQILGVEPANREPFFKNRKDKPWVSQGPGCNARLIHNPLFRAAALLRPNEPVSGILAAHWPRGDYG
jgi:hypothetical protein